MSSLNQPAQGEGANPASISSCFTCTRLNNTTFLIIEDDKWSEEPFIYAKIYEKFLVLFDTGCGGASKDESAVLTSLREFIETVPLPENNNQPLNPVGEGGERKNYVVLCTHCHFDHIGGIAQFNSLPGTSIWASSYKREFIEGEGQLPTTSLCRFFGMDTPTYKVTQWADDGQPVIVSGENGERHHLGLTIYQTPGHTPDQIAIWDPQERVIFVGDTLYEWTFIIFPMEGDLKLYSDTMVKLKSLVKGWNEVCEGTDAKPRVKMACGHITSGSDAEELIDGADHLLYQVVKGFVQPADHGTFRDEVLISYSGADGRVSFSGPKKYFDEFRSDSEVVQTITNRHE